MHTCISTDIKGVEVRMSGYLLTFRKSNDYLSNFKGLIKLGS